MFGEENKFRKLRVFNIKSSFLSTVGYRKKAANMVTTIRVLLKFVRIIVHSCLLQFVKSRKVCRI
jgi:hypothetical protein